MKKCSFSKKEAKQIETNYHKLYEVADNWVADKIQQARHTGYVELAFKGRLHTPVIATYKSNEIFDYHAEHEARSAGNALTQSYCILTIRALNEFMERVWNSKYKYSILPMITIHDANYFLIQNKVGVVKFLNDNLIDCMMWNKLSEIQHPTIHLEAELDLYYPNWDEHITLPNNASKQQIKHICAQYEETL